MGDQRKVGREIAISLAAGGVFALGLILYLVRSIQMPQPPVLIENTDAGGAGDVADDLTVAGDVAGAFVEHLGAARFADAYALMADSYRARHSEEAFHAAWTASPLLASPRAVRLTSTRSTMARLPDAGFVRAAMFTARGALVAAAGSLEVTFTFLRGADEPRILAVTVGGVPIVEGLR